MQKDTVAGVAQTGVGSYLAYKGLEHFLPRTLGIRTEYHITSKKNARLIKESGNYLDPKFGGQGWSAKVQSQMCMENSKNYIHITGIHNRERLSPEILNKLPFKRELVRRGQLIMYNAVGTLPNPEQTFKGGRIEMYFRIAKTIFRRDKTKIFYIPGIICQNKLKMSDKIF